ncbi:MAG: hypothetical protein ABSH23_08785 [Steroidobacteraceae bacterium]
MSPEWSWWPAPAKLNLFLHVVGRFDDGYHALQTLFQLIDRCDSIGLRVREDGAIERIAGPPDIAPEEDLAVRAARALRARTGVNLGAELQVLKSIPTGGGLGGGSSDAATVLLGLNRLWGTVGRGSGRAARSRSIAAAMVSRHPSRLRRQHRGNLPGP